MQFSYVVINYNLIIFYIERAYSQEPITRRAEIYLYCSRQVSTTVIFIRWMRHIGHSNVADNVVIFPFLLQRLTAEDTKYIKPSMPLFKLSQRL